ncbi:MAG TPA: hypothetical protein VH370_11885 [Humisphaera sp.]|jgi:hypothetical protein|nr:hypothetical protein [Humisphaera sp.]
MALLANRYILLALLLVHGVVARGQQTQPTTNRTNPLIGKWETFTIAGKNLPEEFNLIWTIDDKYITVTDKTGDQITRDAYTISMDASPHTILMKIDGEKDRIGWFEIKDKKLRIILTINTGKPPKSWNDGTVIIFRSISSSSGAATKSAQAR